MLNLVVLIKFGPKAASRFCSWSTSCWSVGLVGGCGCGWSVLKPLIAFESLGSIFKFAVAWFNLNVASKPTLPSLRLARILLTINVTYKFCALCSQMISLFVTSSAYLFLLSTLNVASLMIWFNLVWSSFGFTCCSKPLIVKLNVVSVLEGWFVASINDPPANLIFNNNWFCWSLRLLSSFKICW